MKPGINQHLFLTKNIDIGYVEDDVLIVKLMSMNQCDRHLTPVRTLFSDALKGNFTCWSF